MKQRIIIIFSITKLTRVEGNSYQNRHEKYRRLIFKIIHSKQGPGGQGLGRFRFISVNFHS